MRPFLCDKCGIRAQTPARRGPLPRLCVKCKPPYPMPDEEPLRPPRVELKEPEPLIPVELPAPVEKVPEPRPMSIISQGRALIALRLRKEYCEWAEIAEACGYPTPRDAYDAVHREMLEREHDIGEAVEAVRAQELSRLERIGAAAFRVLQTQHLVTTGGKVVYHNEVPLIDDGPVLAAVKVLVKVSESRRKLLGLDAPAKVQNDVAVHYTVKGIADEDMP